MTANVDVSAAELRDIGLRVGVDAIGATTADPFVEILPALRRYYAEGRESGFEHPVAEERIDPRSLCPESRSLVAVALSYATAATASLEHPRGRRGVVSRYAWGDDYHGILRHKLDLLAGELVQRVGRPLSQRAFVDTSPLSDRAVAARAGIGWIGKNGSLITDAHGSWVFLGTLATEAVIEATPRKVDAEGRAVASLDECGDCDLCLVACPTGALVAPYELDSKKCLSYITQAKGMVPQAYRKALGRRMWGCDTCQTVCPKNTFSLVGTDPSIVPDADLSFPDPIAVLNMTGRQFRRVFGHTAAAWRGFSVWKRNALIALGNMRDREAFPTIVACLKDARPEIRASAAWALRRIDPRGARPFVRKALDIETDPAVRLEMAWAETGTGIEV